jgi:hypothetical protein
MQIVREQRTSSDRQAESVLHFSEAACLNAVIKSSIIHAFAGESL